MSTSTVIIIDGTINTNARREKWNFIPNLYTCKHLYEGFVYIHKNKLIFTCILPAPALNSNKALLFFLDSYLDFQYSKELI